MRDDNITITNMVCDIIDKLWGFRIFLMNLYQRIEIQV